ncbi:MAG: butyrate kinase [Defluviitaleaceae bacterium]|nr:butyrate kinase [Defluviitaleaceae bacterium]
MKILVINPGSTSTKIALFDEDIPKFEKILRHTPSDLDTDLSIQYNFRLKIIENFLKESNTNINDLSAIIGIGGLLKPVSSGTYIVNEKMLEELISCKWGTHASNLGGVLAYYIGKKVNKPAYIADPVVVDEFDEIARISGHPKLPRKSIFHALNQKAIAYKYSKDIDKKYEDLNLVIVHMGGGISVSAHKKGRVVDSNNALNGDGPFTPQRSGSVPVGDLIDLCFLGKYTKEYMHSMILGCGGLVAYFKKDSVVELEEESKKNEKARLILEAMAYQISKEIGAYATVLKGNIDAILLTGGIANSSFITNEIKNRVGYISKIFIYPGEDELAALNKRAYRVLKNEEKALNYE